MVVWVAAEKDGYDGARYIHVAATKKELMQLLEGENLSEWNIDKRGAYTGVIG